MKILGIDGLSEERLRLEIDRGARFVHYEYCISVIFMTFKRPTDIYYIPSGVSGKAWLFTAVSFFFGWWGVPWGPIYTISAIYNNLRGGHDVTADVLEQMTPRTDLDHDPESQIAAAERQLEAISP